MAKRFSELRAKMPPDAQARAERLRQKLIAEMPLQELRRARELSQVELAKALKVNQAAISKLESRTDMYISTLRSYIQAMGGELEIVARFPEGTVRIASFSDVLDTESNPA